MNYLLTFEYCGKVTILFRHTDVKLVSHKRAGCKKDPQYSKGKLQIRTEAGFKAKPFL
jgi:hypothetical protein